MRLIACNRGDIVIRAMIKSAGKTTTSEDTAKKAKRLFYIGLIDISWRLAAGMIVPVGFGYWLDVNRQTGNLFTIIGLISGTILAGFIIYRSYKKLDKEINEL